MFSRLLVVGALSSALVGCRSDSNVAAAEKPGARLAVARMTPEAYAKSRERYADSILVAARTAMELVKELGDEYAVAPAALTDSLTALAGGTDCYATGKKSDPYLAGTVSFAVYMSAIGSTLVRVQQANWTSAAGNVVNACLGLAARGWNFGAGFGTEGRQIAQVRFR